MPFAFFGLCLEPEKTYSQTVSKSFRISMASLGEEITSTERSCVKVDVDGEEFVLCSLNPGSHEQQTLDLVFETEEEISLSVTGNNTVHLTGNYLPEEDHDHDHDDMEYDSAEFESSDDDVEGEEDYSDEEEVSQEDLDRLRALVASHAEDDDEDSEEDPDFSELDEDEDDEEDLEDDEEEDEDVDEDMEDAEPVEIGQKRKAEKASPMAEKKMKDNTAAAVKTVQPSKAEKTIKTEKKAEITATESKTTSETQAPADKPLSKKQKKAAAAKAKAEQEAEKAKAKSVEKVAEVQKAKAKPEEKVSESPIKKVLGNGLQIEDVKVGTGVRAKKGKKVGVRYIGKLASNGKVFDKNVSGKPFVFNLGRGEVIKGWDMGVDGMSVGGERRLVIPAVLAYGSRGAPPDIPKNATLEFEVKLLSVN